MHIADLRCCSSELVYECKPGSWHSMMPGLVLSRSRQTYVHLIMVYKGEHSSLSTFGSWNIFNLFKAHSISDNGII